MSTDLHRLVAGLDDRSLNRLAGRREALLSGGRLAAAVAIGALPAALAGTVNEAFAAAPLPEPVVRVLNFALTLEYLEATFYNRGIRSGVIPGGRDLQVFRTIQEHENAHVSFLRRTLGSAAIDRPSFDFTAGGTIPNPFSNYEIFKILAQGFEDAGVRAYKGQVRALKPYDAFLTAAVTIHSVEARHASMVRRLRGNEGWIPLSNPGDAEAIAPIYTYENTLVQFGVNVEPFQGRRSGSEAFDEPLSRSEVLAIAGPFIA